MNASGSRVFERLFRTDPIATLLESPPPWQTPLGRFSICAGGPWTANGFPQLWTPRLGKVFPCLQQLWHRIPVGEPPDPELPFTGGWLGWLGYDLAWEVERLPHPKPDPLPFPVAFWYEPACFAVLDHHQQHLWLAAKNPAALALLSQRWEKGLETPELGVMITSPRANNLYLATDQETYRAMVTQAQDYIRKGDIFQANLSLRFRVDTVPMPRLQDSPWQIYQSLTRTNPSPFASYWQTPWGALVSCSPERLVQLRDRQAQTRPIAGTRPRGCQVQEDQQQLQELLTDPKEQAEHIMLVDLERNDLGRVCTWGSVQVDELLTVEQYSHVSHLVSNIRGQLRPDCNGVDLIRALFPGGTITGCPKVRCMEIIAELEPYNRNLFYGSCGYLDQRGNLDLNILIRSLLIPTQVGPSLEVWGQVGAGIVADSNPSHEWRECLHKAQAQWVTLGLAGDIPVKDIRSP